MPAPVGAGGYPATTLSAEPYAKMPLSGASGFTAEPQDMTVAALQTSMAPSVQLSLVPSNTPSGDDHQHHQAPTIRTQYAYVPATSAAPTAASAQSSSGQQLGSATTAGGGATSPGLPTHGSDAGSAASLGVPRYVVDGGGSIPRAAADKSPRGGAGGSGHSGHSSVHSTGSSVPTAEQSPEYRYGPPSYATAPSSAATTVGGNPSEAAYGGGGAGTGGGAADSTHNPASSSAASGGGPPRDYFPQTPSWTTTAGEAPAQTAVTYANGGAGGGAGDGRPYGFPDQYKSGPGLASIKTDHHHAHHHPTAPGQGVFAAAPRGSFDAISHYSWGAT